MKANNPDIRVEEGTLSINNIQKTNEGHYLCEAGNGIGSGLSAVIMVSVQGMFCSTMYFKIIIYFLWLILTILFIWLHARYE